MKVFLDANILFSGSVSESRIAKLIDSVKQHGQCVTNLYAIEEARKNIEIKKYGSTYGLESLLEDIVISNELVIDVPVELKSKDIVYNTNFRKCDRLTMHSFINWRQKGLWFSVWSTG